ncbi:MAG: hypothetical protein NXI23_04185 [Bacteroidetes bacterium]|jgi:hypothetical protein|nr:hypothetical protein [Bacteroidota bacterium]MDF1865247.1 hypothetical protein [Saprospiraceae bacterium]
MQPNRSNIGLLILTLLMGAGIFFIFWGDEEVNWSEHYKEDVKDPYGTYVIQNLLKNYFKNEAFLVLEDSLNQALPIDSTGLNYIFIGEATYLDSIDNEAILDFVSGGNTAFIASKTIPFELFEQIYADECPDFFWDDYESFNDSLVTLNFKHPNLKTDTGFQYKYYRFGEVVDYDWSYIDSKIFCEEDFTFIELGYINQSTPNFAKAIYGDGAFYFHTTPIAFTNISLLEESGLEYTHKIFSHLVEGTIYWDQFSRIPENIGRSRNQGGSQNINKESPLRYILSQPPLAWAWYLLLSLALLYVIFRAKRKQRIIPILEQNTNTSLEFIGTIGRLYFLQNNHRKLALQKMTLFLGFVREHYHIPTKDLNETFVNQLVAKSEIPKPTVDKILLIYQNIKKASSISENTLIDFHHEMERFYKNCK